MPSHLIRCYSKLAAGCAGTAATTDHERNFPFSARRGKGLFSALMRVEINPRFASKTEPQRRRSVDISKFNDLHGIYDAMLQWSGPLCYRFFLRYLCGDEPAYRVGHFGRSFILRRHAIAAPQRLRFEEALKQGCDSAYRAAIFDAFGAASVMVKAARTRIRAMDGVLKSDNLAA